MRHLQFTIRKGRIFRYGKEIEGLSGGVHPEWVAPRGWVGALSRSVIEPAEASAATAEGSGQDGWWSHRPTTETKADADTQTNADSFFRILHETKNITEKP